MACLTRLKRYPSTPPPNPPRVEAKTEKKRPFFSHYEEHAGILSTAQIARDSDVKTPTARRWLREHDTLGSAGTWQTRKLSIRLGRKSQVTDEMCKMIVSPSNPVCEQLPEVNLDLPRYTCQKGSITDSTEASYVWRSKIQKGICAEEATEGKQGEKGRLG